MQINNKHEAQSHLRTNQQCVKMGILMKRAAAQKNSPVLMESADAYYDKARRNYRQAFREFCDFMASQRATA